MFWNKTLLEWEEPRFAQKYIAKQLRFKDYLSAFGKVAVKLFLGSYIVIWLLGWLSSRRNSNPILSSDLMIIAFSIVIVYFLISLMMLWGSKVSKPQVWLRKKDVAYMSIEGGMSIPYKKMGSFSIIKANLEGNEYFVLQIKNWDGNENFIEIDPKINKESIIEILKSKNVQMKTPLL